MEALPLDSTSGTNANSRRSAVRPEMVPAVTASCYLLAGLSWTWLADQLAVAMLPSVHNLAAYEIVKDWVFVLFTAISLYLWLDWNRRVAGRLPVVESALEDSEAQFRSFVEMSPDGIVVHDRERILYANPGFRNLLGLAPDASLDDMRLRDFILAAERERIAERIDRLSREIGTTRPVEFRMRTADGRQIEVEHASCSLRQGGRIVVQSHVRDVSAGNETRRELQALNGQLERRIAERTQELVAANRALESFTYSVAHDLRAPVAHVDGFAKALEDTIRRRDPERAAHFTQRIVANTRLMSEMIEGLLNVSRAERAVVERRGVDMTALVKDVVQELSPDANVAVVIEPLPGAHADRALLRQVWCNLISNAVKYSAKADRPAVRVSGTDGLDGIVYCVQDNGVGFDPAEGERLFNVFQRLSNARDFMGSGVGLTIVKRIVERHGGRAWATGEPGRGAQFCFSLPA